MQVIYERCCGIDVHKKTLVACVIGPGQDKHTRTFETMSEDIEALGRWLASQGVTHVAMESTGVYWKPVFNLLEGQFEILVCNAAHVKQIAGRKTDVQDAEWLADLLRHGLLRGSFIPGEQQRVLRDLTRFRASVINERVRQINRLQKVLEDANLKLASVASDIMGVSARHMLEAMLAGESDPQVLAELAKGRLRKKKEQLHKALAGRLKPHHRLMVTELLLMIDQFDETVEHLDDEIDRQMQPFVAQIERLDTIPGVSVRIAQIILAEVGTDMKPFPDAERLASWAGMCPGNDQSAGKRRSGKTRRGSVWLRRALTEAAHAAARTKGKYLAALYHRVARRRGKLRALIAVGHAILKIVYHLITRQQVYQDLGANYFDEQNKQAVVKYSVKRLQKLGFAVQLAPAVAAPA